MAKVSVDVDVVVNLSLTLDEARWLLETLRNPIYGEDGEEGREHRALRSSIFNALHSSNFTQEVKGR